MSDPAAPSSPRPRLSLPLVAALLFGSGLCALVYQTAWLRSFRLIFGASTPATAAVLAIFMGGLGVGSLRLGPYAQKHPRPLYLYGRLELAITIGAAASPLLLEVVRAIYIGVGGSAVLGGFGAAVVRLVLAVVTIGAPIFLMGGTLPAAGRAITAASDLTRRGLAVLYGVNTLGGVAGALLTTFVAFEVLGTRWTLWLACGVNLVVALLAMRLSDRSDEAGARAGEPAPEPEPEPEPTPAAPVVPSSTGDDAPGLSSAWVLTAAFVTGFVFFLSEIVWYRLGSPILGGSTFTFGLILAVALLGIGGGGLLYTLFGSTRRARPEHFAITCALEALLLLVPFALGDRLAVFTHHLHRFGEASFGHMVLGWVIVTSVIVLPAALVAGYQFPLLLALKGRGRDQVASDIGRVYAANTLGSIAGSLAGGFGLLPLLTAPGCWRLAALLILAVGVGVAARELRRARPAVTAAFAAIALVTVLASLASGPGPIWRHTAIGAGRAWLDQPGPNELRLRSNAFTGMILEEHEGWETGLAFVRGRGLVMISNGKSDGDAVGDAPHFIATGLMGSILHPDPKTAYVVGLGSGQTAGWLAEVDGMERVDVVELEADVLDYAELCATSTFDVLHHPKVNVGIGDAREVLLTTKESYDLIVSQPSNPYRAGMAGFYSVDFYEQTADRLAEGGLFIQWLQAYEVDVEALAVAIASIRTVYPHVSLWNLPPADFLLIASREPRQIDVDLLRSRIGEHPYDVALGRLNGLHDAEGLLARHLARAELPALLGAAAGGVVNTDDRPVLEYLFARTAGVKTGNQQLAVLRAAFGGRVAEPPVRGSFDGARRDYARLRDWEGGRRGMDLPRDHPWRPLLTMWRAIDAGDLAAALAIADAAPAALTRDPWDRIAIAELRAHAPADAAARAALETELDALAAFGLASDAAWIRLVAAITDGDDTRLAEVGPKAVALAREDPWVGRPLLVRSLELLRDSPLEAGAARVLTDAFAAGAFALHRDEHLRREVLRALARRTGDAELIAVAFELDEPYPSWTLAELLARREAYRAVRAGSDSDLVRRAERDVERFLADSRPGIDELLERARE